MPRTQLPVKRGERLQGTISAITMKGMGVLAVTPDYPLYIADTLLGETVTVEVIQVDKLSGYGRLVHVDAASPDRIASGRDDLIAAGTAPLVNWRYEAQLAFKQQYVQDLFDQRGFAVTVAPTVPMAEPTYYRNKTIVPVKSDGQGLRTGFFERGTHNLVPLDDYFVNHPVIDRVIATVRDTLDRHAVSAYDPDTQQGLIRYIMVRRGYYTDELMVVLVSNRDDLPAEAALVADLSAQIPNLASVMLNISPHREYVLLSPVNRVLYGEAVIYDHLNGDKFAIGPNSFYQVNPTMTETLYQTAARMADLQPSDCVVDAYSGIGTIGIGMSHNVRRVVGVEVIPGAVTDAQANVQLNGVTNVSYVCDDAPRRFRQWQAEGFCPDVVVVDPPRRGLTQALITATAAMAPQKVVYISCNPVTLVRDAEQLLAAGYVVTQPVQPLDQFPQTSHVETVTVFVRQTEEDHQ